MKKKINRDPFSNGTAHMLFEEHNCDRCIKSSHPRKGSDDWDEYTKVRCSIQRDIYTRMWCHEPIKRETVRICDEFILHGVLCPYLKTEWPKRRKHVTGDMPLFNQ